MTKTYQISKILAHGFEGSDLLLKTAWLGYPLASHTWEPMDRLNKDSKEAVDEYYDEIGVTGLTDKQKAEKLKATAVFVDRAAETAGQGIKIKEILGHGVKPDSTLVIKTEWENGEIVEMPRKQFSGGAVMLKKYLNEHGLVVTRTPKPVRHSAVAPGSRVSSRRRVIDSDDSDSEAPSPKRRAASRRFSPAPAKSRASKRIAAPSTATRTTATSSKTGSVKIINFFKAPDNAHMCVISENGQLNLKSVAEVRRTHPKLVQMAIEKSLFAKL